MQNHKLTPQVGYMAPRKASHAFHRILPYFTVFYRISHETLVGVPCGELCIWHHKKAGLGSETPRKQCGCAPKPPLFASLGPPLSIPLPGQGGHFQGSYGRNELCQVVTWRWSTTHHRAPPSSSYAPPCTPTGSLCYTVRQGGTVPDSFARAGVSPGGFNFFAISSHIIICTVSYMRTLHIIY